MKQSKKLMCILLSLIITLSAFLPCVSALAATVEECKLSIRTSTKLNIRTSTKYKYMNNWAYPNSRNGIHLATVAEGNYKGEPAYCIEFGKDMGDNGQSETVMDIDKVPAWEEFNANQKAGITRATIYGYPNFNYGVSDEAAQVATQFVVWEYSQGYRTSANGDDPTAGLNGTSDKINNSINLAGFDVRQQYYKSGVLEYSDVKTAYKGILNGIKNHKVIPSFNSDTIELNWNSKNARFEASVTDTKKVLSLYQISSKNSSLKFSKSGNTLTIYTSDVLSSAAEVTMTKTCAKVGADIGFVPPNQNVNQSLVGRLTDPVTAKFTVKTATGNLKISKTSEDEIIKNIPFTVKGNGKTYNLTTDDKGNAELKNIPVGTYQIYEGDILRYVKQAVKSVTVTDGNTANVSFKNELKKGNIKIQKNSEDKIVKDFTFKVNGSDGSTYSAKTNGNGIATITDVPVYDSNNKKIVYTVQETNVPVRYVTPDNQTVTLEADKTSTLTFNNELKKFRVKVVKSDIEKGKAQGDAKLSGAKYGIFKGEQLIDTYTTDDNASFTTKYYICDTDWTIRELESSEGYLVNDEIYKVGADPKLYEVEYNTTANDVVEQVIKGNIAIIKHTDDGSTQIETPEKGAEFQVYLKSAGSFVNADKDEKDTIVCDEDGFASTKLLPYGVYTVHQTKGWEGREKIKDFDVYINSDGKTYKFLINNANFESYIKVAKYDAETGKQIPYAGAGFEIYDNEGHRVSMQFTYPEVTSIHTFYTNSEGYLITPEKLPYGDYSLVEVQAPYGYVLDKTPIPFKVTQENSSTDTGVTVIKVKAKDVAQKGVIEITKEGEIFSSVGMLGGGYIDENGNDIEFPITYNPIYETKNLSNAVFQIYAAEDIATLDGTIRAQQGELVDEITTADNGIAKSKPLYLGKYTVIEKTAPNGYVNSNEQYDIELTYAGQNVSVTSTALSVYNERQKVSVSLEKSMAQDERFMLGMNNEILSVQFGIYANEDIKAADGSVIPKDALITYGNCDENGKITFNCDLPISYKFYAKEMAADEHYILSDKKYEFTTEYQGQEVQTINIDLNSGQKIENELIYGTVKGYKTDRETGKTIEGALFGLFKSDETEFTEDNAILICKTDKDGIFTFENVPFGNWIVKELKPAKDYLPSDDIHHITVSENEQIIEIKVINDRIPELKTTATVDGEKEICATEIFTLIDKVEYQHLVPSKEYVLKGVLMDKTTGKALVINGETVMAETIFIPTEPTGTANVEFIFDAKYIKADTDIVVFESLYKDGKELAVHADIEDEGQTVTVKVPEIKTTAKANGKKEITAKGEITIDDIVKYTNLTPGKKYKIVGTLMDKSTGKVFEIDGKPVTSEVTFTPEKSNGKVTVSFTFDSSAIKETTDLVVFETLYRDNVEIAVHADLEDEGQTVKLNVPTPKKPSTPKTGDDRNYGFWIGLGFIAIGGAVAAVILKIKVKKDEDEE